MATTEIGEPVCPICVGITPKAFQIEKECDGDEGLEGRTALCNYCGKTVKSKWSLPFFEYCPDKDEDHYYCGCEGWD